MALSNEQKALCAAWVTAPNRTWQTLNRSQWKYQFREKTLVRYVEEAKMDEDIVPLLLEYLSSDDCKETLQLYGQGVASDWTPTKAWYEISNKAVGSVRAVRLYHAIAIGPADNTDGPYVVEDGCAYKVSWEFHWNETSVPRSVGRSTSGVSVRITNISPNPETGLFNYTVETRERVQQDIPEYLMKTTQFEDVSEEVHLGVRGELSVGGQRASVSNGKTVTRKVTKNQDCTHDVHNTITQDKASPEAEVTVQVGLRGTAVTTTNRNMPSPASTEGLEPGESVRNQKTDSQLWNQTIRHYVRGALVWLRGTCRKTIFAHSHSETTNVKDNPGFDHAVEASDGVIHEISVHKTEEGYDVTSAVTEENPVSKASEIVHVGLGGTTRTVTHRNQPAPAPAPTEVGETVTNEKTQGGRWNITIRERVRGALRRVASGCAKTIFAHRHSSTRLQSDDPGFLHVENAGGGRVRQTNVVETEDGFRVDESETTELPVVGAEVVSHRTLRGVRTRITNRNQPTPNNATPGIGGSVSTRRTGGGSYDNTVETFEARPVGAVASSATETRLVREESSTENGATYQKSSVSFSDGTVVRRSSVRREDDTCDVTEATATAKPWGEHMSWEDSDGEYERYEFRNQPTQPEPPHVRGDEEYVSVSYHYSINQFGYYDGAWQKSDTSKSKTKKTLSVKTNLKFTRRSPSIQAYEWRYKMPKRKWQVRTIDMYAEYHYNDSITDFYNDLTRQNPGRTNAGVVAVKKNGSFGVDLDGNPTAIWVTIERNSHNAWADYDESLHGSRDHVCEFTVAHVIEMLKGTW